MDKKRAIDCFIEHFRGLCRLPLITDVEMEQLYGIEVASAIAELDRHNREAGCCAVCDKRCCRLVDCEFYAPELDRCVIFSLRPALCRMHFCHHFPATCTPLIKEVGDIFLSSVLAAESLDRPRARLFDAPPLGIHAPFLVAAISPLLNAFRDGTMSADSVLERAQTEADKFRTPPQFMENK